MCLFGVLMSDITAGQQLNCCDQCQNIQYNNTGILYIYIFNGCTQKIFLSGI